jgi:hypothetical protein
MAEAIPILGGITLGVILHGCRGKVPGWITAALVAALAASATIASGEFRVSWGYLLVDSSLVIAGAALFLMAAHPVAALKRNHREVEPQY